MYQRPWDIESKASKAGCSRNIRYVEKCSPYNEGSVALLYHEVLGHSDFKTQEIHV
jgi:hypothetical protein